MDLKTYIFSHFNDSDFKMHLTVIIDSNISFLVAHKIMALVA